MINILACTCANRSGVGAIDNPDLFEQTFDQYIIPEVPEKIFTYDISTVRRQKMLIVLNLLESVEKNVEVPWKNERYISSAQ